MRISRLENNIKIPKNFKSDTYAWKPLTHSVRCSPRTTLQLQITISDKTRLSQSSKRHSPGFHPRSQQHMQIQETDKAHQYETEE